VADTSSQRRFELPLLEDANSVQVALMKVIQMLGAGSLDHKTAGLMLYALQTASANLRNADFEVEMVSDIVVDRDTVNATCINGPQWFVEDFDDPTGEEDAEENEADDEDAVAAGQADAAASPIAPTELKHITMEEARMQVKGAVRDWLLETVGKKPQ
jgi:hypothetical protein